MSERWITKETLLQRIQESDPKDVDAWDEFVSYYQTFIEMLLNKWKFAEIEKDDLVQEILLRIWKAIPNYEYRKGEVKFRTWLSRLIKNAMLNYIDKLKRRCPDKLEFHEILFLPEKESNLERLIEKEWNTHLIGLAMNTVSKLFSGQAANVFKMSLEGNSIGEISSELNITESSAYTLRCRFKARFIKEFNTIKDQLEGK